MAVLNFFPVQKLIFDNFIKLQKMEPGQQKIREFDLFDFTSFFRPGIFLIFWPTVSLKYQ